MASVPAGLPAGVRVSDHISLGVIAKTFPPDRVQQMLAETGKADKRDLPGLSSRPTMEPIRPSVWRSAKRNTARKVSPVRMASGE